METKCMRVEKINFKINSKIQKLTTKIALVF